MRIENSKLGDIEIEDSRVVTFPEGIPGFSDARKCVLLTARPGSPFRWLLSVDNPEIAFVVAEPFSFFPSYEAPLDDRELSLLGFEEGDELAVLNIVTIRGRRKEDTTFNLRAPVVVNMRTMTGRQFVLKDERWDIRASMPVPASPAG